jgi:co-chaperonin GroES (HSP10)
MEMTKEKAIAIGEALNYQPIGNRLIVLAPKPSDTTKSGIIKSDSMMREEEVSQEQLYVIKLSKEESVQKSGIEVGDKIITRYTAVLPIDCPVEGYHICETDLYKTIGYIK